MLRTLLVALLGLLLMGCSPSRRITLCGTVNYNDQPVVCGQVIVQDRDGNVRVGTIQPDGTYRVDDLVPGPLKIAIESPNPHDADNGNGAGAAGEPGKSHGWRALPEKYGDLEQSELRWDAGLHGNEYNITLKSF